MRRTASLLLAALALSPRPASGSGGAEPFDFLSLDAGARAVAMGGAYTALASDSSALLYNPSGLARVRLNEATFMHNRYLQGASQEYAAFASPRGWGLQANFLSFGSLSRTTYANPDGSGLGEASLTDMALGAGYARPLAAWLAVGAGGKYIQETIDGTRARSLAADLGAMLFLPALPGLSAGICLQNAGPSVRFQTAKENLPLQLRSGAAFEVEAFGTKNTVALDLLKGRSQGPVLAAGAESRLAGPLAVRAGFCTGNDAGLGVTAGFGLAFESWGMDYAFVPMGDLGSAHRLSATMRWAPRSRKAPVQEAALARPEPSPPPAVEPHAEGQAPAPAAAEVEAFLSTASAELQPAEQASSMKWQQRKSALELEQSSPTRVTLLVQFEADEASVAPADQDKVAKLGSILQRHPGSMAVIEGHADISGAEAVNLVLSRARADAVRALLIEKCGIEPVRLEARGFGSSRPIATNWTPEGRAINRRVEIAIEYSEPR
jgi:outer membrane protein OmpA-like peptidoglycan-associated protein